MAANEPASLLIDGRSNRSILYPKCRNQSDAQSVVILPNTGAVNAQTVAERIRQSLEGSLCHCEGKNIKVTASIGLSQLEDDDNQHLLFDKADKALYRAKEQGRNQVVCHEPS